MTATYEIVGSKESRNRNFMVIIAININDRRLTEYTIYNNVAGTKRIINRSAKK